MSKYYCSECKYSTGKTSNFKAHLTTTKHLINSGKLFDKNKKEISPMINLKCEYCEQTFNTLKKKEKHVERTHNNKNNQSQQGLFTLSDVKEIIKTIIREMNDSKEKIPNKLTNDNLDGNGINEN